MTRQYTAEEHKAAFGIWSETRNLTQAARSVGSDWGTVKRWAQPDFKCSENCPWHGWERLLDERERALAAKLALINKGEYDPVEHDKALREAVANQEAPKVLAIDTIIRSDLERVSQLELLWSKVFYDITGIVTDWKHFRNGGADGIIEDERLRDSLKGVLRGGLHTTSMKDGVGMLKTLRSEIEAIVGNARTAANQTPIEEEQASREELRRLRQMVKTLSPEELKSLTTEDADRAAS